MELEKLKQRLEENLDRKNILENENMEKHTTFKIGGPADLFVKVQTKEELAHILKEANALKIPMCIIGNGSNLLVKDKGIRGLTLKMDNQEKKITKRTDTEYEIEVGAGYPLIKLAYDALKEGLTGLEFASGIPGTVGGAVRMNAGAYGSEIKNVLLETTYMDEQGKINTKKAEEQNLTYRHSIFCENKNWIILSCKIRLSKGDPKQIKETMEQYQTLRKTKQPINFPSAGSTFKRKEGVVTAALIDQAGLKGCKVGDAEVSTLHAGFVINKGKATAQEVLELTDKIKEEVKKKFNEDITLEIEVIGE